ncbi:MAG: glucose-6-phosphate isomerase, partial [Sphingomonadales bacterium]|nr:glucose-6-phosphate isomerase [Sphingomonadales bacterium]
MTDAVRAAWADLAALDKPTLKALFAAGDRLAAYSHELELPGGKIRFDWSKTHLDAPHVAVFERLAAATGFAERRAAMFAGDHINVTENRAVEHTAQRGVGREA